MSDASSQSRREEAEQTVRRALATDSRATTTTTDVTAAVAALPDRLSFGDGRYDPEPHAVLKTVYQAVVDGGGQLIPDATVRFQSEGYAAHETIEVVAADRDPLADALVDAMATFDTVSLTAPELYSEEPGDWLRGRLREGDIPASDVDTLLRDLAEGVLDDAARERFVDAVVRGLLDYYDEDAYMSPAPLSKLVRVVPPAAFDDELAVYQIGIHVDAADPVHY